MNSIYIDLNNITGQIKLMHAANNGPVFKTKNYDCYMIKIRVK